MSHVEAHASEAEICGEEAWAAIREGLTATTMLLADDALRCGVAPDDGEDAI